MDTKKVHYGYLSRVLIILWSHLCVLLLLLFKYLCVCEWGGVYLVLAQRPEEDSPVFCHPLPVLSRHDLSLNLGLTFPASQEGPAAILLSPPLSTVLEFHACVGRLYVRIWSAVPSSKPLNRPPHHLSKMSPPCPHLPLSKNLPHVFIWERVCMCVFVCMWRSKVSWNELILSFYHVNKSVVWNWGGWPGLASGFFIHWAISTAQFSVL